MERFFFLNSSSQTFQCTANEPLNQLINPPANATSSTSLVDLPLELLLIIYENFDLVKLTNVAATHPINSAAAEILYRQKYGKLPIRISGRSMYNTSYVISETNTIILYNFNLTLAVLKIFGHLISSLLIDYESYNEQQRIEINQFINKNCAETLSSFEIGYCSDNEFASLPGPFINVKSVRLKHGILKTDNVRFDEIFPSVRRLDMGSMLYKNLSGFEYTFAHLEHLEIGSFEAVHTSKWAKIFEMNSHIRSVSIYKCNLHFLKFLNEKIKKLESLEISIFDNVFNHDGDDIQLDDLKNFMIVEAEFPNQLRRKPLVMPNLEEFTYPKNLGFEKIGKWFDVLIQSKHLKKLAVGECNYEQLMRIANELQELEDITTWYDSDNLAEDVISFIETGKSLRRVEFKHVGYTTQLVVKQQLGSEWEVTVQNNRYVFLKKL